MPFAVIDPLVTFTSGPDLWNLIMKVTTKMIGTVAGQNYDGTAASFAQLPDLGALYYDISPQVQACNACAKCRVPEFRFVWL